MNIFHPSEEPDEHILSEMLICYFILLKDRGKQYWPPLYLCLPHNRNYYFRNTGIRKDYKGPEVPENMDELFFEQIQESFHTIQAFVVPNFHKHFFNRLCIILFFKVLRCPRQLFFLHSLLISCCSIQLHPCNVLSQKQLIPPAAVS